jgi:hypothetical protein
MNGVMELQAQVFGDAPAPKMATGRGNDPKELAEEVFRKLEHEQE